VLAGSKLRFGDGGLGLQQSDICSSLMLTQSWSIVSRISAYRKLHVPDRGWSLAHLRLSVYCIFVCLALNSKRHSPCLRLGYAWVLIGSVPSNQSPYTQLSSIHHSSAGRRATPSNN